MVHIDLCLILNVYRDGAVLLYVWNSTVDGYKYIKINYSESVLNRMFE